MGAVLAVDLVEHLNSNLDEPFQKHEIVSLDKMPTMAAMLLSGPLRIDKIFKKGQETVLLQQESLIG